MRAGAVAQATLHTEEGHLAERVADALRDMGARDVVTGHGGPGFGHQLEFVVDGAPGCAARLRRLLRCASAMHGVRATIDRAWATGADAAAAPSLRLAAAI